MNVLFLVIPWIHHEVNYSGLAGLKISEGLVLLPRNAEYSGPEILMKSDYLDYVRGNNHRFLPVTRTILIIYTGKARTGYIMTICIQMAPAQPHFSHPS